MYFVQVLARLPHEPAHFEFLKKDNHLIRHDIKGLLVGKLHLLVWGTPRLGAAMIVVDNGAWEQPKSDAL